MLGETSVVITLLGLLIVGQIATVVLLGFYLRRVTRALGDAIRETDARVGRVGVRVRRLAAGQRSTERSIKALAVRIRDEEIETGVDALNRYLLLAGRHGAARD